MNYYINYDAASGQIVRCVRCSDESAAELPGYPTLIAQPDVSDVTHRVAGGAIVELPARPSPRHEFDHASAAWVDHGQLPNAQAGRARARRDAELSASDKTQLLDYPISPEQRTAWAAYRAALRAVPDQPGFPTAIDWPARPA